MEDIRLACGISRGGLYHHFANRRAILDAIVADEIAELAGILDETDASPLPLMLRAGASHLGNSPGVLAGLRSAEERQDYLSGLEQAITKVLSPVLRERLAPFVRPGVDPDHVAELFLTINTHINRHVILGNWTEAKAAGFAATALGVLTSLLHDPFELDPVIADLKKRSTP